MEKILASEGIAMSEFKKKVFKLTLETFRQAVKNQPIADRVKIRFESICKRVYNEKQLNALDLYELTTEYKLENVWMISEKDAKIKDHEYKNGSLKKPDHNSNLEVSSRSNYIYSLDEIFHVSTLFNLIFFVHTHIAREVEIPNKQTNLSLNGKKNDAKVIKMSKKDTEINRLFEEKNYEKVIEIVESNFLDRQCLTKGQITEFALLMFLQSLLNIVSNFNNFFSATLLNERDFLN